MQTVVKRVIGNLEAKFNDNFAKIMPKFNDNFAKICKNNARNNDA
ncbi:hypothetical protein LTSEUGA_1772 [Salmonella enterica subsp. enterica serovar Uganda str. R8-3404]|uniref:Uncharacterized protein n=1 Tax=Salmonella enterica subsp. enterica serovar Uganda str. R8-3404 TaxID=913083 RepID=A0A6C8H3P2_SALET|nr:hypothetical protein LTSEUGA_1772 [Salmonella enterica subsp. enterica serovar Uganda str. R8-3404]